MIIAGLVHSTFIKYFCAKRLQSFTCQLKNELHIPFLVVLFSSDCFMDHKEFVLYSLWSRYNILERHIVCRIRITSDREKELYPLETMLKQYQTWNYRSSSSFDWLDYRTNCSQSWTQTNRVTL
jgi:hypothetical protein